MNFVQAVILSALQGFTELVPLSSLGIQAIVPHLMHWSIDTASPEFLPFVVALHMGTALALIVYFRRDWAELVDGFFRSLNSGLRHVNQDPAQKTVWLLIVATIPAGLVGLLLKHRVAALLGSPLLSSLLLIANGLIMIFGDRLIRHRKDQIHRTSYAQGLGVGVAQIFALLPGLSRSGLTMVGGLTVGLSYQTAARLSFLMATPIILAAGLVELPKLHGDGGLLGPSIVGFAVAGTVAYLSVRYLMRYFARHRLMPFGWASVVLGVVCTVLLMARF